MQSVILPVLGPLEMVETASIGAGTTMFPDSESPVTEYLAFLYHTAVLVSSSLPNTGVSERDAEHGRTSCALAICDKSSQSSSRDSHTLYVVSVSLFWLGSHWRIRPLLTVRVYYNVTDY